LLPKRLDEVPVAGRWQCRGGKYELVITTNRLAPETAVGGQLQVLSEQEQWRALAKGLDVQPQ
jgi:hypothetical protein